MPRIVGIDLGTTNSAVAYLGVSGPELIPNALGGRLTPSVVGVDESGTLLVGATAKEYQVLHPERCASVFKRYMGTDQELTLAGKVYTPEELSSLVLRSLKADAEAFFKEPVTHAVITVPAYFNDRQRKSTIAAGKIAGFTVERIVNEPTAAAIAYGFHENKDDKTILVFDLGGGTFDVSVVEFFEGALEVKSSAGETNLGGEDFTRAMAARVLETQGIIFERAEHSSPLQVSRLIQQCERAKVKLSVEPTVTVKVANAKGEMANPVEVSITREQMEAWISPTLARLMAPIRRALSDAKLNRSQISEVILVGGATRMPAVQARVEEIFNAKPHCRLNPDEVVALGAAVQAGLHSQHAAVEDLIVTDVAPFSLGIEVSKNFAGENKEGYFDPVIERNSTIPISRSKIYSTVHPNQTMIKVVVRQGESRKAAENLLLGQFDVKGIPAGPAGQPVEIRLTYDLNGVLEVEATILATKQTNTLVITKNAKAMTDADIQAALKDMARLKVHPREEEGNRYLLRRAERIYQELSKELRGHLGDLLDGFENSLQSQDADLIKKYREALEQFLSAYSSDDQASEGDKE